MHESYHRAANLHHKDGDKIIVLQNGYIKEMGTHEELMEKKGYYYELVKLQTGVDEL